MTAMPSPRWPRPRSRSRAPRPTPSSVVYEPLQPVMTPRSSARAGRADPARRSRHQGTACRGCRTQTPTNIAMRMELRRGDIDKGFAEADIIVEHEFQTPMVHQGYIEPHACVARYGEDGQVLIWSTTQGQFIVRDCCAGILGIDAAKIKVIAERDRRRVRRKDSGLPGAARGRAVAQGASAGEDGDDARRGVPRDRDRPRAPKVRMKIGAKTDGTLIAASASLYYEAGAYRGSPAGAGAMCCLASYAIPNFFIEAYDIVLNRPKVAAYRAPGSPVVLVRDRIDHRRDRATHRHGSDRAASQERGRRKETTPRTGRSTGRSG